VRCVLGKIDRYRAALSEVEDWDRFLMANSGLPGPRGNIELAMAAAGLATRGSIDRWLALDENAAPTNTPEEFLAFCGTLALGRLVAEGDVSLTELRQRASDGRWRTREGVAMALQMVGDHTFDRLVEEMEVWAAGNYLEQRAAAAALCEPRLLTTSDRVGRVLEILDTITSTMRETTERQSSQFKTLRQGMGYCWSVAVAAAPEIGKPYIENWVGADDPDVRWIMRQNLSKKRLERMDAAWVADQRDRLGSAGTASG
jgi:hypothetical protein